MKIISTTKDNDGISSAIAFIIVILLTLGLGFMEKFIK